MKYLTSKEIAKKWGVSERSVRNYCNHGRVKGAYLEGKTWLIFSDVEKPIRKKRIIIKNMSLLKTLRLEKKSKLSGRIYHKLQVDMTYNSNHIEGSKLTHDQTRMIFETNSVPLSNNKANIDDIIETMNHFRCIDYVIDMADKKLNESLIKQLHLLLKSNTSDSFSSLFNVGDYKKLENEVGEKDTTKVKDVKKEMKKLLDEYNSKESITVNDIIDFHYKFECIHPFQDGNGRVGRLIMLKECLKHNIVPILIKDEFKEFYYRGLKEYKKQPGYLIDTCLHGQDIFKSYLDKLNIKY